MSDAANSATLTVTIDPTDDGIDVTVHNTLTQRPQCAAWGLGPKDAMLALRLRRAILANAVCYPREVKVDTLGRTYLSVSNMPVGRRMSATLRALGY